MSERLTMYDSLQCTFLKIKKPPKQKRCPACGPDATIKSMKESLQYSEAARGPSCSIGPSQTSASSPLSEEFEITCADLDKAMKSGESHVLLDVRVKEQFDLCSLPGAVNVPLASIEDNLDTIAGLSKGALPVYCMCRRGVASVAATRLLIEKMKDNEKIHSVKNIQGGLNRWRKDVDNSFPKY